MVEIGMVSRLLKDIIALLHNALSLNNSFCISEVKARLIPQSDNIKET